MLRDAGHDALRRRVTPPLLADWLTRWEGEEPMGSRRRGRNLEEMSKVERFDSSFKI